jgi:hypothetical protein
VEVRFTRKEILERALQNNHHCQCFAILDECASHLASESRKLDWVFYWYVWPDAVRKIIQKLEATNGGIIGLVGLQGVGKSSALLAILTRRMFPQDKEYGEAHESGEAPDLGRGVIRFKWRRQPQLLTSLLNGSHELSGRFSRLYKSKLVELTKPNLQFWNPSVIDNSETLNPEWAERQIGRKNVGLLRQAVWLEMLRSKETILIDTPDYSKTDRRLMAKDVEELYWLRDQLSQ